MQTFGWRLLDLDGFSLMTFWAQYGEFIKLALIFVAIIILLKFKIPLVRRHWDWRGADGSPLWYSRSGFVDDCREIHDQRSHDYGYSQLLSHYLFAAYDGTARPFGFGAALSFPAFQQPPGSMRQSLRFLSGYCRRPALFLSQVPW